LSKQAIVLFFRFNENCNKPPDIYLVFLITIETKKQAQPSIFQKCDDPFETSFINKNVKNNTNAHCVKNNSKNGGNKT
jgi:hypothetical protein